MAKPPRNPFKPHGRNFPGARLPPKPQPKKDADGVGESQNVSRADVTRNGEA
jgi:hypothetical protein